LFIFIFICSKPLHKGRVKLKLLFEQDIKAEIETALKVALSNT
jgi:hypothetical protein